jgi:hypothetical protein
MGSGLEKRRSKSSNIHFLKKINSRYSKKKFPSFLESLFDLVDFLDEMCHSGHEPDCLQRNI